MWRIGSSICTFYIYSFWEARKQVNTNITRIRFEKERTKRINKYVWRHHRYQHYLDESWTPQGKSDIFTEGPGGILSLPWRAQGVVYMLAPVVSKREGFSSSSGTPFLVELCWCKIRLSNLRSYFIPQTESGLYGLPSMFYIIVYVDLYVYPWHSMYINIYMLNYIIVVSFRFVYWRPYLCRFL